MDIFINALFYMAILTVILLASIFLGTITGNYILKQKKKKEKRKKRIVMKGEKDLLTILNIARIAIDTAIYTEDGLDGLEGEELINRIEKILTRYNVKFTPCGPEQEETRRSIR